MGLTQLTPATSPVSLEEAKAWCRVDDTAEDTLIATLIASSVSMVEEYIGRSLGSQTWLLARDDFSDVIELPRGPVTAVAADGVKYFDDNEVEQTLDPSIYQLDLVSDPQRIVRDVDETWPTLGEVVNAVQITFTTGYSDMPSPLRIGVLSLVAHWYDNRVAGEIPAGVAQLLSPYRRLII